MPGKLPKYICHLHCWFIAEYVLLISVFQSFMEYPMLPMQYKSLAYVLKLPLQYCSERLKFERWNIVNVLLIRSTSWTRLSRPQNFNFRDNTKGRWSREWFVGYQIEPWVVSKEMMGSWREVLILKTQIKVAKNENKCLHPFLLSVGVLNIIKISTYCMKKIFPCETAFNRIM